MIDSSIKWNYAYAFIWLMLFYVHILKQITLERIVLDTKETQLVVYSYTV